jgi:translation initiation factor IF-1
MSKEDIVEFQGKVEEVLPGNMFRVKIDQSDHVLVCYTCGKLKRHKIRVIQGDRVKIEVSAYDLNKGRVVYRL